MARAIAQVLGSGVVSIGVLTLITSCTNEVNAPSLALRNAPLPGDVVDAVEPADVDMPTAPEDLTIRLVQRGALFAGADALDREELQLDVVDTARARRAAMERLANDDPAEFFRVSLPRIRPAKAVRTRRHRPRTSAA